jgi:hypothetical protein
MKAHMREVFRSPAGYKTAPQLQPARDGMVRFPRIFVLAFPFARVGFGGKTPMGAA